MQQDSGVTPTEQQEAMRRFVLEAFLLQLSLDLLVLLVLSPVSREAGSQTTTHVDAQRFPVMLLNPACPSCWRRSMLRWRLMSACNCVAVMQLPVRRAANRIDGCRRLRHKKACRPRATLNHACRQKRRCKVSPSK